MRSAPGSRTELAALLPGLEDPGGRHPERHDASAQLRLFEALLELLDVVSEDQPLLLILEDIHWADRSTRTFAAFLARSLRVERVAVVLTYRTDELHRRHPLRPLLGSSSDSTTCGASSSPHSTGTSSPRCSPTSSGPRRTKPSSIGC